jgi:peptidoglycan/xylan/chitin deacetylase (PgdA/CDA1 family)
MPSRSLQAPTPSSLARVRSKALRSLAAHVVPASVLFVRGKRAAGRKRLALTFDDGPDELTPRYLDLLEGLGVRATFFLVGEGAAQAPRLTAEYAMRGHDVGGHGWSHQSFCEMDGVSLAGELARTQSALPPQNGARPLVRPPRGAISARTLLHIAAAGFTTVLWSLDSDDCRTRDPRTIERRLAPDRVSPGEVVLLHEMQPWTLDALPGVVGALRKSGWELVTVSSLMQSSE